MPASEKGMESGGAASWRTHWRLAKRRINRKMTGSEPLDFGKEERKLDDQPEGDEKTVGLWKLMCRDATHSKIEGKRRVVCFVSDVVGTGGC